MADLVFPQALRLVLAHEGGYVNNPADPGGPTNKGVTKAVYDAYRKNKGLDLRSVKSITPAETSDIYKHQYWDMVDGDRLPPGVDYAVFDYAVNSGAERAVKDLQRVIGSGVDGQVGEDTVRKTCAMAAKDEEKLIADLCGRRMAFLKSLRTWKTFGKGWGRRVEGDMDGAQEGDYGVVDYATMIARKDLSFPIKPSALPTAIGEKEGEVAGKGAASDVAITKTPQGRGIIAAAAGTITTAVTAGGALVDKATQAIGVGQKAGSAAQQAGEAAQNTASAVIQVHDAAHKVFGVLDPSLMLAILTGSTLLSFAGCAFFGWHYLKSQHEKTA